MAFHCTVVTPEQQVLDETVTQAIVPGHDGKVGILTDRAPLLLKMGFGELRLDVAGGQSRRYYVEGGIAQMKDNRLTVLTEHAQPAESISAESARAELAEAEARKPTGAASAVTRQKQLDRARAKIAMTHRV